MTGRTATWMILGLLYFPLLSQSPTDIVNAPDRAESDKARDSIRKPAELLEFMDLKPGMRIADLGAGGGYSSELIARAVGKNGVVYAQNPEEWVKYSKKKLTERQKTFPEIVQVYRPFNEPMDPKIKPLDGAAMVLIYHDTVHLGVDRTKMNRAVFEMLKPGGFYIIIDHSARKGDGAKETKTLHRIEESVVRQELEAAGFQFVESATFLRDPKDARDFMAYGNPQPGTDRFVLKFRKPQ